MSWHVEIVCLPSQCRVANKLTASLLCLAVEFEKRHWVWQTQQTSPGPGAGGPVRYHYQSEIVNCITLTSLNCSTQLEIQSVPFKMNHAFQRRQWNASEEGKEIRWCRIATLVSSSYYYPALDLLVYSQQGPVALHYSDDGAEELQLFKVLPPNRQLAQFQGKGL